MAFITPGNAVQRTQISNLGFLYALGFELQVTSPTDLSVGVGQARDSTNSFDIVVNDPLTVSTSFIGPGGRDQGAAITDGFYAVYLIFDYTNHLPTSTLLSTVSTAPLLPQVGNYCYTNYRLIGYVNVIASALDDFRIVGTGNQREYFTNDIMGVLSGGTDTTFTPVPLSLAVPDILGQSQAPNSSVLVGLVVIFQPFAPGSVLILKSGSSTGPGTTLVAGTSATVPQIEQVYCVADFIAGQYFIQYVNSDPGDTTTLAVTSFKYMI